MGEEDDEKAAEDGDESKASFVNQKPPRPLSSHNRLRAGEAAPELVTWTWKRRPLQGQSSRLKLTYRKTIFEEIKSVLTTVGGEKLVQRFSDGCFGHLLRFDAGVSCNRALFELITHEINLPGAREHELWFHIGGTNIRFSPAEYALVTGLRFGSFTLGSREGPSNGVYNRFCSGCPITIKELLKRFSSQRVRGSPEDYLKVANILTLYQMALGYEHRKKVEQWVWVLVEDLDLWNRYPWGAYTYQALLHCVSKVARTTAALGPSFTMSGPVWALLIWAYEAIPHLGNTCAFISGKVTVPRCLKWSFTTNGNIDFIPFFKQELVCFATLEPTDEEQLQAYWASVCTPQPLGVLYALPRTPMQGRERATAKHDSSAGDASSEASSAEPLEVSDIDGSIRSTPSRKGTRASSGGKNGEPQHLPEGFDEDRFVDRVSCRVVDRLIKPVAEMVTERLVEPAMERLTERLIPRIKQSMEDVFRRTKEVYDQVTCLILFQSPYPLSLPQPKMWEVEQKLGLSLLPTMEEKKKKKRKRTSRPSPSSSEATSKTSSGYERGRKGRRCKRRKAEYYDWSSSESDIHRRRRKRRELRRRRRRSSSSDPDAQDHHHHRPHGQQDQLVHSVSLPD